MTHISTESGVIMHSSLPLCHFQLYQCILIKGLCTFSQLKKVLLVQAQSEGPWAPILIDLSMFSNTKCDTCVLLDLIQPVVITYIVFFILNFFFLAKNNLKKKFRDL